MNLLSFLIGGLVDFTIGAILNSLKIAAIRAVGKAVSLGTIRELFAVSNLESSGYDVFYSQSGGVTVNGHTFETGGQSKTGKQVKNIPNAFVFKDDVLYGSLNTRPLYLLGFLR